MWYLLLTQLFWFSISPGPWCNIRKVKSIISRNPWWKIRKVKSTKGTTYFTRLWFSVLRAQAGRFGFRDILPISDPTLTCGLGRICVYVDGPHCSMSQRCSAVLFDAGILPSTRALPVLLYATTSWSITSFSAQFSLVASDWNSLAAWHRLFANSESFCLWGSQIVSENKWRRTSFGRKGHTILGTFIHDQ